MHGGRLLEILKKRRERESGVARVFADAQNSFRAGASAFHIWQVGARDTVRAISGGLGPHVTARRVVDMISPLSRAPSRSPPPSQSFLSHPLPSSIVPADNALLVLPNFIYHYPLRSATSLFKFSALLTPAYPLPTPRPQRFPLPSSPPPCPPSSPLALVEPPLSPSSLSNGLPRSSPRPSTSRQTSPA